MYNQHTRGMATPRHRSLVDRGGRKAFVRDKGLAQTSKSEGGKNGKNTNLKKIIRAHKVTRLL